VLVVRARRHGGNGSGPESYVHVRQARALRRALTSFATLEKLRVSRLPSWRNWQTRMVHVPVRVWGFDFLRGHH
jgi:hypothetical protein